MTRRPLPRWPAAFSTASRDAVAAMVWTRAVDAAAAAGAGGRLPPPARAGRGVRRDPPPPRGGRALRPTDDAVGAGWGAGAAGAAAPAGAGGRYGTPARMRRVVAGYLAHVEAGQPMRRLARVAGFDRRQLQRACAVVEELRERAQWDAAIADLGGLA